MKHLFALLLTLSGCTASTVAVRVSGSLEPDEVSALLYDAGAILDLELVRTTEPRGAITLSIHDSSDIFAGEAQIDNDAAKCVRAAWAEPDANVIAHEIGHTLGLGHTDDEDGVMFHDARGDELSDDEQRTIGRQAWRLGACRPGP